MTGRSRGADALIPLLLALSALVFWKLRLVDPAFTPERVLRPNHDVYTQIYPMALRGAAWLKAGTMPLWNPFQYCGHPFLATGIYGVLYPLNFPYLLFPTAVAIEVVAVMHLAAAGIFTHAFARTLGLPRSAALVSGLVFMFSGYVVLQALWFQPAISAAAWLPLSLLAVEKVVRTRRLPWAIVFGTAVALAFLAGWPQIWLYSIYVISAYTCVRLFGVLRSAAERAHCFTIVVLLGCGTVVAAGLMMGQLLPGLELQAQGPRRAGGLSLAQMLVLGGPVSPGWIAGEALDATAGPRMPYVGILALVLLPASLFLRPQRSWTWCFWALMLFSLAVVASPDSPAFDLYRALPGARWFRAPMRFLYVHAFAAALLSGAGFASLMTAHDRLGAAARAGMTAVVGIVPLAVMVTAGAPAATWGYLAVGIALAVAILWLPHLAWRRVACVALLLAVWWSLFNAVRNDFLHPYKDLSVLDAEREVFDYIHRRQGLDRTYIHSRLEVASTMAKQGTLREVYTITDYEPLSLLRYDRFYRLLEAPENHRNPLHTFTGQLHADPALPSFDLLNLLSVRYVVVPKLDLAFRRAIQDRSPKWRPAPNADVSASWMLYENSRVLPRAYVAYDVRHAVDEDAALAAVASREFDPWSAVVLENAPPSDDTRDRPGRIERADIQRYEPAAVTITTDTTEPGYLVLTDTFYPGWRATIDGVAAPILRANYLFRAVQLPPGRHTVAFEYAPRSFAIGITATMLTLGIAVLSLGASAWRARRRVSRLPLSRAVPSAT